jgi:hypothetical protein
LSEGRVEQAQGSEERVKDMVGLIGFDQRGQWHDEAMSCHGMAMFWSNDDGFVYHFLSGVFGRVEGGQGSTNGDLMVMV